jgi:acyl-CoA thioester hydrolase
MILKTLWHKILNKQDKKSQNITLQSSFKYKAELEMRFVDLDAMGHVNNAIYFTYMEIGRTKYWQQAIKWNWRKTALVIRTAGIEYFKPIVLGDKVSIYVRTSRIGSTSFDLEYEIVKTTQDSEITCSKGKTTCVVIDHETKRPTAIPEREKIKMIEFEQL